MIITDSKSRDNVYNFFVRYFDYLIIIFVIVFGALVYNYYFKDVLNEIQELQDKKINLERETYESQAHYLAILKDAGENLANIPSNDVKRINSILPSEDEKILLFHYLDKLVKDNDLNMQSIKFSDMSYILDAKNKKNNNKDTIIAKEDAHKYISRLKVNMQISGVNYEKLKLLLSSIENNLRLIDIDFFNFSSLEDGELNVSAVVYYEPKLLSDGKVE